MFYFTYQTKNLITGKTYIGVHKTSNLNDGYIGGGIYRISDAIRLSKSKTRFFPRSVVKHGYENFKLEILCFFDTYEECLEEEKFLVDMKWVKSKSNYNALEGGQSCPAIKCEVFVYCKDGNFVDKYDSYADAAIIAKTSSKSISKVIINELGGSRLGFRFFKDFKGDKIEPYNFDYFKGANNPKARSVEIFDIHGKFLNRFGSVSEAGKYLGIPGSSIVSTIQNKRESYKKKYIFKYTDI